MQLQFSHNSQVGLQDLLDGNADVALGKADITADMETAQQISSRNIFKCVTPVSLNCPSIRGCFACHDTLTHCTCALRLAFLPKGKHLANHSMSCTPKVSSSSGCMQLKFTDENTRSFTRAQTLQDSGSSGMVSGYPFPITTSAWPELALSAHPNTNQSIRKAVAEALYRCSSSPNIVL